MKRPARLPHPSPIIRILAVFMLLSARGHSQDIEPRRWSHLPIGGNFIGGGYAYTKGDISFNPVLRIEDGEFDLSSFAAKYIHSFEVLGKSARFDMVQTYQSGTWSGKLNGVPTSVDRSGWSDSLLRLAVNLYGAPPLAGKEFIDYRMKTRCETIVGMGLVVQLPTGEYFEDKLINLGTNRFIFTPQLGVVHTRGRWSFELSSSVGFATENDSFFNDKTLEEDAYLIGQGHVIYTFKPGLWLGASAGYGYGGESTINGDATGDRKGNLGWGLSMGIPVNRSFGFKVAYIGTQTQQDTGADTNSLVIACSYQW